MTNPFDDLLGILDKSTTEEVASLLVDFKLNRHIIGMYARQKLEEILNTLDSEKLVSIKSGLKKELEALRDAFNVEEGK